VEPVVKKAIPVQTIRLDPPVTPKGYVSLSIAPASTPRQYHLIETCFDNEDNVLSVVKSEMFPFHIAVYKQKRRAAELWTGGNEA
jgi:hypothetical protein